MDDDLVKNLASGLSGFYGDFVAVFFACCCIFFIFARFLQVLPSPEPLLLDPLPFALSAVALWTSTSTKAPVFHQHLTMLPFVLSCFIRFAGTWTDDPHSVLSLFNRIFSRASEYTMLYCAFTQPSTCNPIYALGLVVLLAMGRSNEILRAWNSGCRKTCTERRQFDKAITWFDNWMVGERLPTSRPPGQPQHQQQAASSQSQLQVQVQSQSQPQVQLAASASSTQPQTLPVQQHLHPQPPPQQHVQVPLHQPNILKPSNSAFQLGYLWIDGSGTLVTATMMLFLTSFISLVQSMYPITFLSVSVTIIYMLVILYLCLQCLPGLLFIMNCDLPKLMRSTRRSWLDNLLLWARDWFSLRKDVANWASSPFRCHELPNLIQRPLFYAETFELSVHVLIVVVSKLTLHALVITFPCILQATRLLNFVFNMHHLRRPLIWFMTHFSRPEVQLFRDHFVKKQKFYTLVNLSFERMDTYSTVQIDDNAYGTPLPLTITTERVEILQAYCPVMVNGEQKHGYGYLTGVFVDLEEISKIQDRSNIQAMVGGWVMTKDPQATEWVMLSRWGDADPDPNDGDNSRVASVYQGIHNERIWAGNTPGAMEVHVKWGSVQDAVVITHIWQDNQVVLGLFDWAPPLNNAFVYADDVTSHPSQTTWRFAWRRQERFFLL